MANDLLNPPEAETASPNASQNGGFSDRLSTPGTNWILYRRCLQREAHLAELLKTSTISLSPQAAAS